MTVVFRTAENAVGLAEWWWPEFLGWPGALVLNKNGP